jgi:hypothetical protein
MKIIFDFTTLDNRDPSGDGILTAGEYGCYLSEGSVGETASKIATKILSDANYQSGESPVPRDSYGFIVSRHNHEDTWNKAGLRSPLSRILLNTPLILRYKTYDISWKIEALAFNRSPHKCPIDVDGGIMTFENPLEDFFIGEQDFETRYFENGLPGIGKVKEFIDILVPAVRKYGHE